MGRERGKREGSSRDRVARGANWATILGAPIGIAALLFAFLALQNDDGEPVANRTAPKIKPGAASDGAQLEPVDLIVHNEPFSSQFPQGQSRLEMLIHNAGDGRSVVSRARIEIRRLDPLPICFTQGGLALSESYDAQLPASAEPGDVVEVPLHQQLGPDQADRFTIDLSVLPDETEEFSGYYLFELQVSLLHDGEPRPLDVGKALVSIPVPPGSEAFLTKPSAESMDEAFNTQGEPVNQFWASEMACWRSNAKLFERALAGDAARSPQLDAALDDVIRSPSFADLES